MSQPYVGQILMFAGSFAPAGWMTCQGQSVPISEYDTLFNLIGTTYGGDGQEAFNLPDLQGRVPIHMGQGGGLSNYVIGQKSGTETVTLTSQQIPSHNHLVVAASSPGSQNTPSGSVILADEQVGLGTASPFVYTPFNSGAPNPVTMAASTISTTGGNQPHENIQPVITVTYIIAMFGVFPTT